MITINSKQECCGCTACANACPTGAISMMADFEGFKYPKIDEAKCVNCSLCEKVCPILNKVSELKFERKAYVLRSVDIDVVNNSTSGGFITPLANWIFENDGVICGASFDDKFNVVHKITRGYINSEVLNMYKVS